MYLQEYMCSDVKCDMRKSKLLPETKTILVSLRRTGLHVLVKILNRHFNKVLSNLV